MKTYKNLYKQIISFENLIGAAKKASLGKTLKLPVMHFNFNLEDNCVQLHNELKNHVYKPGLYRSFYICEPKKRLISAAPFRDRVVHHALCNIIEPIFNKTFIYDSYANRKGKGTHAGIRRVQDYTAIPNLIRKLLSARYNKRILTQISPIYTDFHRLL